MKAEEEDGLSPENNLHFTPVERRHLSFYLLPFLLFPLILIGLAFFIVPTRWFMLHSGNTYMANIGYGATLYNTDCQVLVYGDSTALTDLNPLVIQQRTGLSACNIAEFEGMTGINGTILVDEFLAHNPRPRYIVFMYAPEDLRDPPNWRQLSSFEALTYRLQHYRNLTTAILVAKHPLDTLNWAEQGMRMSLMRFHTPILGPDHFHVRDPYRGQLHHPGEVLTDCDKANHDHAPDRQWIQNIRQKYGVDGTSIIVDATPAPPCEFSLPFILTHLPDNIDDLPYPIYPVNFYMAGTRLHMMPAGSDAVSNMVSDQILARIHASTSATNQIQPTEGGR